MLNTLKKINKMSKTEMILLKKQKNKREKKKEILRSIIIIISWAAQLSGSWLSLNSPEQYTEMHPHPNLPPAGLCHSSCAKQNAL